MPRELGSPERFATRERMREGGKNGREPGRLGPQPRSRHVPGRCEGDLPQSRHPPADLAREAAALAGLRRWAGRYAPMVAGDGADGLMADISGVPHLFGGEEDLREDLQARLERAGLASVSINGFHQVCTHLDHSTGFGASAILSAA